MSDSLDLQTELPYDDDLQTELPYDDDFQLDNLVETGLFSVSMSIDSKSDLKNRIF